MLNKGLCIQNYPHWQIDSSPSWNVLTMLWNTVTLGVDEYSDFVREDLFHERYFLHFIPSEGTVIKVVCWQVKQNDSIDEAGGRPHQFCLLKKYVLPSCIMPIKCVMKF